jgi:hypothetical protein
METLPDDEDSVRTAFAVANSEAVLLSRAPYGNKPDREIVCLLDTGASANLIRKDSPLVAAAKVYKHAREKKIILADGSCSF